MKPSRGKSTALSVIITTAYVTVTACGEVGEIAIYRAAAAGETVQAGDIIDHEWDTIERESPNAYALRPDKKAALVSAGHHLVIYNARFDDPGNNGSQRSELQSQLQLGGIDLPSGWSQCYMRRNNDDYEGITAGGAIIDAPYANAGLVLRTRRTDENTDDVIREPDASAIQVLKLDDGWDYCRLSRGTDQAGPNSESTWVPVQYDTQDEVDTNTYAHTSGTADIVLKTAGRYLVFANTYCEHAVNNTRALVIQRLTLSGGLVDGSMTTVYLRGNSDGNSCLEGATSIGMVIDVPSAFQVLNVTCVNGESAEQITYKANRTAVTIVKLPDTAAYIRLNDSGADNMNTNFTAELGWDIELEKDHRAFTHDDSRVGARAGGDFLFLTALYDNDDDNQRIKYWQRWRVNDGTPAPYGHSGRYARNSAGADECGNWSGILLNLSKDDYVETVSERLANGGFLNAEVKGLQAVYIPSLRDRPNIVADGATHITPSHAVLNATLSWTGSVPAEVWAYWGGTDQGTNLNWDSSLYFGTNTTDIPVAYSNSASGLSTDTTYVYRFRARSNQDDVWTEPSFFKTAVAPEVQNTGATPGASYALLGGQMPVGDLADVTVYWGESDGGTDPAAWAHANVLGSLTNGPFEADTRTLISEPWTHGGLASKDILPLDGIPGSTVESGGNYTLTGAGADIWGTADQLHYAYRIVTGDFDVYCKVGSFSGGANGWRKAGIMARESLNAGSRNVTILRTPTNGQQLVSFQMRDTTDGASSSQYDNTVDLTNEFYWVRLVRTGTVFSGFWAEDNGGVPGDWTSQYDTVTLDLSADLCLGIGITSHEANETTTLTFSDLTGDVHPATGTLIHGVPYVYRSYATNAWGDGWADVTPFTPAAPTETVVTYRAGLLAANVPGALLATPDNPGTQSVLGPEAAKTQDDWPGTSTYIYTGEIYFNGNPYVFVESIDDDVWMTIDGEIVMNNGLAYDRSSSGVISKPAGWYDFELRMYQGGGGSGYSMMNPGIQYNTNGLDSLSEGDNWYPEDDGNMSLFRHLVATEALQNTITNLPPTDMTETSATLAGTLDAENAAFDVYVYWGAVDGRTNAAAWAHTNHVGAYTNLPAAAVSYSASGLTSGTTYAYAFRAVNPAGSFWATPSTTFQTVSEPMITNRAPVALALGAYAFRGELLAGGSADVTVYWGTSDGGTAPDGWANTNHVGTVLNGGFSTAVTGLSAGQTYTYRSYAENAAGADWSDSAQTAVTELPEISIADAGVTETDAGTTTMQFTVTLDLASATHDVRVDWTTRDNTAHSGGDYVAAGGQLTIPQGSTSRTISIMVNGDTVNEGLAETFTIQLTNPLNGILVDGEAVGTIADNDMSMSDWAYRMKITFSGYTGTRTLTNFPALVVLNESLPGFSYASVASPQGHDLRFMDAAEMELLPYETEDWNAAGDSYVWVRVPTLSSTNTYIWAYWGNPYRMEPQPSQTDGSVWTQDFEGVWHMNHPSPLDSTAYNRDGVANDDPQVVTGVVSTALSYDGVDDWASIDYVGILDQGDRTLSAWIKKAPGSPANVTMMSWGRNTAGQKMVFRVEDTNGGNGGVRLEVNGGYSVGSTPLRDGQWHHVAGVLAYDGNANVTDAVFYVDGTLDTIAVELDEPVRTVAHSAMRLGGDYWNANNAFDSTMDEARVASVARSGDWLRAAYLTVADNSAFVSYGAAGPADPDAPLIAIAGPPTSLVNTSAWLQAELVSTGISQTAVWAYWGTEDGGQYPGYWANAKPLGSIIQIPPVSLSVFVDGLTPSTVYYYAFAATNSSGGSWAPSMFTTPGPPSVTTDPATGVSTNTATLSGTLTGGGGGEIKIFWGLSDAGTDSGGWDQAHALSMPANGGFSATVAPLANGTYFFRCYVTNDYGESWAESSETFTTPMSTLSVADLSVDEASSPAQIAVSLSWPSAASVSVDYATADGTATEGSDYTPQSGRLTIPPGAASADIAVPLFNDGRHEWPYETFTVSISNVTGAILADSNAIARIIDNDSNLSEWKGEMKITFAGYTGTQVLTNFPALVVLGPSREGFSYDQVTSPEGLDLRFTDATGSEFLDFEIEEWNTNGDSFVWVRVPQLTARTAIWAYWGNPDVSYVPGSQRDGSVWNSDHLAVYHMHTTNTVAYTPTDTNAVGFMADVTTNGLHALRYASEVTPTQPSDSAGLVAGGQYFGGTQGGGDGANAQSYRYTMSPSPQALPAYTVMVWCKPDLVGMDNYSSTFNNSGGDDFQLDVNGADPGVWQYKGDGNGSTPVFGTVNTNWNHLALSCNPEVPMTWIYFNGQQAATLAATDNDWGQIEIGTNRNRDNAFTGLIDEVRVMRTAASEDWINAVWKNTGQNAVFNEYGAIDTKSGMVLIVH